MDTFIKAMECWKYRRETQSTNCLEGSDSSTMWQKMAVFPTEGQLVQRKMEQASECSNKPLLSLSLSTDSTCWLRNRTRIHAREHKIQLGKSLGSFQACLNCRAGFVLQSSKACACKHLSSLNMLASAWSVVSQQVECLERLHYREVCYQKNLHLLYYFWNFSYTSAQEMQQALS